jgi:hypothetical protein
LQVSPAGIQDCVSRDIPAPGNPVSTGSIAILMTHSRLWHRAMGALESNCGNRNLFSRRQKPAPQTAQRQHETVTEIIREVGTTQDKLQGT